MPNDTVVIVISRRPSILTLASYNAEPYPCVILAAPEVFEEHSRSYPLNEVYKGGDGIGAQVQLAYALAFQLGFKYWVRLDDDLPKKTFVDKYGYPELPYVIDELRECLISTETSLAGLANSTNKSWFKDTFSRTFGMIHGGCNIAIASEHPEEFAPLALKRNNDVWRSAAHRRRDGAVGRVQYIGFDKGPSTLNKTTLPDDEESIQQAKDIILAEFSDMVTCDGWREIGGKQFPNWRMLRGKNYKAKA